MQEWTGARAITVSGPQPYAPKDVLAALAAELGKPLRLDTLAQDGWAGAMAGGFSPEALEGFIEMTRGLNSGHIGMDTDPEAEHWAGSIPLAAVGGMARRFAARFPERVGAARADRNRPGMGRLMLYNATRRVFGKFLLIGLIYSMILNNPPERVFKREK